MPKRTVQDRIDAIDAAIDRIESRQEDRFLTEDEIITLWDLEEASEKLVALEEAEEKRVKEGEPAIIRYEGNEEMFHRLGYREALKIVPHPCPNYQFTNQNPNMVGLCKAQNRLVMRVYCEQNCLLFQPITTPASASPKPLGLLKFME